MSEPSISTDKQQVPARRVVSSTADYHIPAYRAGNAGMTDINHGHV
jgi:hypothetical protein